MTPRVWILLPEGGSRTSLPRPLPTSSDLKALGLSTLITWVLFSPGVWAGSFPLPPRVQSQPIKNPKQCGLRPASLACKTFPANEATLFAGRKKYVIFLTWPLLGGDEERERSHFHKQTSPEAANEVHAAVSGPADRRAAVWNAEGSVRWGGGTRPRSAVPQGCLWGSGGGGAGDQNPPDPATEPLLPLP